MNPNSDHSILLVEDDDALRHLISRLLRRAGYDVVDAPTGHDALEALDAAGGRVDLLITDLILPRMTGDELAQQMRARLPEVRVLLVSGYRGDAVRHYGIAEDDPSFLQKPYEFPELLAAIERELAA